MDFLVGFILWRTSFNYIIYHHSVLCGASKAINLSMYSRWRKSTNPFEPKMRPLFSMNKSVVLFNCSRVWFIAEFYINVRYLLCDRLPRRRRGWSPRTRLTSSSCRAVKVRFNLVMASLMYLLCVQSSRTFCFLCHQCCGFEFFPSRILIFSIPDPGSASKNLSILTQNIVS